MSVKVLSHPALITVEGSVRTIGLLVLGMLKTSQQLEVQLSSLNLLIHALCTHLAILPFYISDLGTTGYCHLFLILIHTGGGSKFQTWTKSWT